MKAIILPDDIRITDTIYGWTVWSDTDNNWVALHDERIQVVEDLTVGQYDLIVKRADGSLVGREPIESHVILRLQKDDAPPPQPPPSSGEVPIDPAEDYVSDWTNLNVRADHSTNAVVIRILTKGTPITVDRRYSGPEFVWLRDASTTHWIAERKSDNSVVYLEKVVITPPPTDPPPTSSGRVTIKPMANGFNGLSVDGVTPEPSFGARLDRLFAYKEENMWAAPLDDFSYWGNPSVPGDKTLGKIADIQKRISPTTPAFVSYFSAYAYPGGSDFGKMIQRNIRMLDWCERWGLMGMPIIEDAFGVGAHLWENSDYHTQAWGQFDDDFWLDEVYTGVYWDWLESLLNAIKGHPALGAVFLFNEAQINEDPAGTLPAFKKCIRDSVALVKGIVDTHVGIDIINGDHVYGPGATRAIIEQLYLDTDIDIISGHYYQHGASQDARWDFEKDWLGQVARRVGGVAMITEWGQDAGKSTEEQVHSVRRLLRDQYSAGVWSIGPWAFDFREGDINTGSGSMASYSNPAFYPIVDMIANRGWV